MSNFRIDASILSNLEEVLKINSNKFKLNLTFEAILQSLLLSKLYEDSNMEFYIWIF